MVPVHMGVFIHFIQGYTFHAFYILNLNDFSTIYHFFSINISITFLYLERLIEYSIDTLLYFHYILPFLLMIYFLYSAQYN